MTLMQISTHREYAEFLESCQRWIDWHRFTYKVLNENGLESEAERQRQCIKSWCQLKYKIIHRLEEIDRISQIAKNN